MEVILFYATVVLLCVSFIFIATTSRTIARQEQKQKDLEKRLKSIEENIASLRNEVKDAHDRIDWLMKQVVKPELRSSND